MQKRVIWLLLLLLLILSGCKKKLPAETLPVETTPASETTEAVAPDLEYATAQINGIPAVLDVLSRGDTVDVVKAYDEKHIIIKLETGYGLVEKNLIRLDTVPAYESWTGYAYQGAELYDNYRLAGEPVRKLSADEEVMVLEDLGWCCLVEQNGSTGYMKQENLAKKPLTNNDRSSTSDSGLPNADNYDGFDGEDGGEISMHFAGRVTLLSMVTPQEGAVSGKAVVLADETLVILGYFDRGDKIPVVKQNTGGEILTVYLGGIYAEVDGTYVQTEDESEYISWNGQSQQIVSVYGDCWMLGNPIDRLNSNTVVKVLYELDNCYLIEVNGVTGYMRKSDIEPAKEEIPEVTKSTEPKPTEPKPTESKPTEPKPTEPKPTEPKPTEPKPTEPKPTEPKPTEPKPTEPKPTEPKPTEPKPTEPKPTEPKPTEPKPTEPKPTEPKPTEPKPTEPTTPTKPPEWTPPML